MRCETCNIEMATRSATRTDPYAYTLVGLPNVRLVGITVHYCEDCGIEIAQIPQIQELHRVIAELVERKKAPLSGAEIRYLRKQAGFSAKHFAELVGVTASTLSRVEADKQPFGPTADRFVRLVSSVVARDGEAARKVLEVVADHQLKSRAKARKAQPQTFRLGSGGWKLVDTIAA